jgi:predicted nucleic acid-binding protein
MKRLFFDTSAWAALADEDDANHQLALAYQDEIIGRYRFLSTNYILDELYTLLLLNVGYPQTVKFKQKLDFLTERGVLEIIWVSPELAGQAWEIFERFNVDKQWSFTDCISYVVMRQQGITEAFTFDRHFSQMGFIRRP